MGAVNEIIILIPPNKKMVPITTANINLLLAA
jgi:hypothetical protein